jgi:CheY-like chemotaxis protein
VVQAIDKMLRRIIGEDVELETHPAPDLPAVYADPGQIEQVVVNLAVNSRDAMPEGGRLTIETGIADLDESYTAHHEGLAPGRYVLLAVSDTGCGMAPEIKARIFEPFFTTKGPGKGTGLGLATVYGIVKQTGGHVAAYSEPGHGTTFKVYLPAQAGGAKAVALQALDTGIARGSETVLLAEDEESVRKLAAEVLTRHGYTVLAARDGVEALRIFRERTGPIHLLLTDVVMPTMGGPEAARQLRATRPDLKVLYVSGYTDRAAAQELATEQDAPYLQKPFTPTTLARKVREVLDSQ